MGEFGQVLQQAYNLMSIPLTVYGFTFSFWQVFIWTAIAGVIVWAIMKVVT